MGNSEIERIISIIDWSKSPLGTIAAWPVSLRITLKNILQSPFPTVLYWGSELICFYNDAFRSSLGNEKHPAIGMKAPDIWLDSWDSIGPKIRAVMERGEPAWFEDQFFPMLRNGRLEQTYWTYGFSPAFGDDEEIAGVIVTCLETTHSVLSQKIIEQKVADSTAELAEAHASLMNANSYLQQIIDLFKEPLQVLEPIFENGEIVDFKFKLTNSAYSAYANTTPAALKDRRVGEVFPGYFKTTSFSNIVKTFLSGGSDTWEIHYDQDGLDLYNLMSATRLGDEIVVHFTDFTKLKQLQIELVRKIEELERSNRNLGEFAYAASHDLKEPIRKIHIFVKQLRDQLVVKLSDVEVTMFNKIETAADRMSRLIDDLMQYSHVSERPAEKEPVNLNEVIRQVLEDLEVDIEQSRATVNIEKLPVVNGYPRQLQQMFQNLLTNAIKYRKPDVSPVIEIRSEENNDGGKFKAIEIRDNGIGFDQQHEQKIFEIFARLHGRTEYKGNGIGLSIVKKVVENHNGRIQVTSKPGEGSAFKVILPT